MRSSNKVNRHMFVFPFRPQTVHYHLKNMKGMDLRSRLIVSYDQWLPYSLTKKKLQKKTSPISYYKNIPKKLKFRRKNLTIRTFWMRDYKCFLQFLQTFDYYIIWFQKILYGSIYEMRGVVDAVNFIHGIFGFRAYKPLSPKLIKW